MSTVAPGDNTPPPPNLPTGNEPGFRPRSPPHPAVGAGASDKASSELPLDTLAGHIKAHMSKADACIEKADQHHLAAGKYLMEAKERVRQTPGLTWSAYLRSYCQIKRRRADELIAIVEGRTTLAEVREAKRASMARVREKVKRPAPCGARGDTSPDEIDARSVEQPTVYTNTATPTPGKRSPPEAKIELLIAIRTWWPLLDDAGRADVTAFFLKQSGVSVT
jgi:hypothetical protein